MVWCGVMYSTVQNESSIALNMIVMYLSPSIQSSPIDYSTLPYTYTSRMPRQNGHRLPTISYCIDRSYSKVCSSTRLATTQQTQHNNHIMIMMALFFRFDSILSYPFHPIVLLISILIVQCSAVQSVRVFVLLTLILVNEQYV